MEPLHQKVFTSTLVTLIKGVAIAGLLADVAVYYATKNSSRIKSTLKKQVQRLRFPTKLQLTKN